MDLRPTLDVRPQDRMATALFVAALLHGLIILGVRFGMPSSQSRPVPTLEVLLVPEGPAEAPNAAASYLAGRDQRGAGTTRDPGRTSLPEASASLLDSPGELRGERLAPQPTESTVGGSQLLATTAPHSRRTLAGEEVERTESATVPLETRALPQVGVNSSAADATLRLRGDPAPDDRLLADTRASLIADYLDGWKRRIEQVGTLNFPDEARRRTLSGNPVLEVVILADGTLEQVLVRRSSGHRELDAAAVRIVRLASPFDPFPPAMREQYPRLRFAYEWQFLKGRLGAGSVWSSAE